MRITDTVEIAASPLSPSIRLVSFAPMAQNTRAAEDTVIAKWESVGNSDPSELIAIIERLDEEVTRLNDRVVELEAEADV